MNHNCPGTGPLAVTVLIFPGVRLLHVSGPVEAFTPAGEFGGRYRVRVAPEDGAPVITYAGTRIGADLAGDDVHDPYDVLVVPGGPEWETAIKDEALLDAVRRLHGMARCTASVCTGAFLLAASGVLDGRRAATHWSVCADFAKRFPAVRVEPDPIFVRDGSVWTSAGVTAGIDLALALVEQDLGRAAALAVARYLVVFLKRPGGQAQFSEALSLQSAEDQFGALHDWIGKHLADDMSLPLLASRAGMSERSFSRHYLEATGLTPSRAVERLRVEAARRLLSESRLPVKRISQRCGFGSEETMRRSFLRVLSTTPQDYRARFSA